MHDHLQTLIPVIQKYMKDMHCSHVTILNTGIKTVCPCISWAIVNPALLVECFLTENKGKLWSINYCIYCTVLETSEHCVILLSFGMLETRQSCRQPTCVFSETGQRQGFSFASNQLQLTSTTVPKPLRISLMCFDYLTIYLWLSMTYDLGPEQKCTHCYSL